MTDLHNTEVPVTSIPSISKPTGIVGKFWWNPIIRKTYAKSPGAAKFMAVSGIMTIVMSIVLVVLVVALSLLIKPSTNSYGNSGSVDSAPQPSQPHFKPTPQNLPQGHTGSNRPPVVHGGADTYLPNFITTPKNMLDVVGGLFFTHDLAFCNKEGKTDASYLVHFYAYDDSAYQQDIQKLGNGPLCDPNSPKQPDQSQSLSSFDAPKNVQETDSTYSIDLDLMVGAQDKGMYRLSLVKLDDEWLVESLSPITG